MSPELPDVEKDPRKEVKDLVKILKNNPNNLEVQGQTATKLLKIFSNGFYTNVNFHPEWVIPKALESSLETGSHNSLRFAVF